MNDYSANDLSLLCVSWSVYNAQLMEEAGRGQIEYYSQPPTFYQIIIIFHAAHTKASSDKFGHFAALLHRGHSEPREHEINLCL